MSDHDLLIRIAAQVEAILTNDLPHLQAQISAIYGLLWGAVGLMASAGLSVAAAVIAKKLGRR